MWKKLLIPLLSIAVLFVFSAIIAPVDAGGTWWKKKVNWRIAGTIAQFIDIYRPDPNGGAPIYDELHSLINLTAYGRPAPAKITLLSRSIGSVSEFGCVDAGYFPIGYFDKNDFVAIFPDQSLLFASIDPDKNGILCLGPAEGKTYFKVQMIITGGTGWLEGASGYLIGEGHGYPRGDVTLVGENGRITGKIILSH